MSELTDTHNIQLTDIEIFVLKYILKNLDVDLKLNFFKIALIKNHLCMRVINTIFNYR